MTVRRACCGVGLAILLTGALAWPGRAQAAACATTACGSANSVTFNGTPLTFAGASTNGTVRSEIWYLVAPPSGAHNVVVTAPNATAVTATSMSFTGVDQTTPLGSVGTAIGTGTTAQVSATAAAGEAIFDVVGAVGTTAPTVSGSTQTSRQTNTTASGLDHVVVGSSTAYGTGSATTMQWTISSADWAHAAVPIKAATALTGVTVADLTATLQPDGVLVQWSDGYEPSSLGFYVFRSDGNGPRTQLNAAILDGGALGGGAQSFAWKDSAAGWGGTASYWIEDVGIDGSQTWFGPVYARPQSITTPDGGMPGPSGAGGAPAIITGPTGAPASSDATPAGGCAVAGRGPRAAALQLFLLVGLIAGVGRRRRLGALFFAHVLAAGATGVLTMTPRRAAAAGGITVDATATGTGQSGLTFSHTMGSAANGLLVVGVVVPINCDDTTTDGANCASCGATCATDVGSSLASGLLGLWHFDEGSGNSSSDASSNGNTASLVGTAWTSGYAGDSVETNGTSTSYVQATIGSWFGGNNTLSVSAWTYVTANSNGPVVGITTVPGGGGWNMPFLSVAGSTVYGWLWQVNGNNPLSTTVSLNAWHFLAITYDPNGGGAGVGKEIFYVDGTAVASGTGTYGPSGAVDYFSTVIGGAKPGGVNSYLLGKVDEVRAYNRTLSAADITSLYGARLACSGSTCAACSSGETACSGTCVTTSTDNNNCGSCGHACNTAGGESCIAGVCSCSSGTDCSGTCVDITTDPNNCGGCGTACGMPTGTAIDTSLTGRWHMDEGSGSSTADSSGNGNTASFTGTPTWTTGYSGKGVTFDGATNYSTANLGTYFGTNSALTASAWVYATSTTSGPIFGVSAIPAGNVWDMPFLSIAGSTVYGWLWQVNSNNPLSATVGLNAWHFLAITYDPNGAGGGVGKEIFYVDGVASSSGTGNYSPSGSVDSWITYIPGAVPSGVSAYLQGTIDEVRAYGRALSAAEIKILYNARQTCSASTCGGCTGGEALCTGDCTDKTIDPANCGSCGTACNTSGGETCISSSCNCASGTDCSGTCKDTTSDNANCGTCGHTCSSVTCASCGSGMSGLWHLDEGSGSTAADSSGNGNGATLNSSPSWTTGYSGSGSALTFNGTSYMTATLGSWWGSNNTLSASAWVYATSSTNGPIFGVTNQLPGTNWDMPFLSINGSTVYGWLWQVNGNTPLSATVSLNAWHFLAITYDPNGGGSGVGQEIFYVDGVASASGTGTYSPSMGTDYLTTQIQGAKPTGVNSILTGTIDELRGYTRVLSAGEISLLYNARQSCSGSSCGGCPTGTTDCGSNVCQNTACGACGSPCSGTQQCVSGTCM